MSYTEEVYERVVAQNPGEPEFHQAVKEVLDSLKGVIDRNEEKYRSLEIPYSSIEDVKTGWALFFPTVTFSLKNGLSYRFIVFGRKKFLSRLDELRN